MSQFEDMQTFVRIVEAGSITRAAEQLDTVKSAVSKRLSELEKRLGVTLLSRTTRKQTLTESGRSYYEQCLRIIDDMLEVEASIKDQHCALSGRIKIAAPLSFGIDHLSPALHQFNEIHPDIFFDVDFNDRRVDLVEEGFDLAVRIGRLGDSSLRARKLTQMQVVLCGSPEYFNKMGRPQRPEDLLNGHVKLKYSSSPEQWHFLSAEGKKMTLTLPSVMISNNGHFLNQAAIDGKGLTLTPDFICYKSIKLGQLEPVLCDYLVDPIIDCFAVYPPTRHLSARVRSLVDYLVQYYGETPYWRVDSAKRDLP